MNTKNNIEKVYTLTPMQEGMLFSSLSQDTHKNDYYISVRFTFTGKFCVENFKNALKLLISHHDILRTVFDYSKLDKIVQIVLRNVNVDLELFDIRDKSDECKKEYIDNVMDKDKTRYFDFINGPLFRSKVFLCDDNTTEIVFAFHHIIIDGWCLSSLIKELFEYYYGRNVSCNNIEFIDYVNWITENKNMAVDYWKNTVSNLTTATKIPMKGCVSTGPKQYLHKEFKMLLDPSITEKILSFAKEHKCTISSLIHMVWALYLYKYERLDIVTFGTVVSGRHIGLEGIENLVGMCLNTVPLSVRINGENNVCEILKEINEKMIDIQMHSHCSLVDIQKMSALGDRLISHIMAFENVPTEINLLGTEKFEHNDRLSGFSLQQQTSYDFCILVIPNTEMILNFQYNANRFSKIEVKKVAYRFKKLLQQIVDQRIEIVKKLDIMLEEDWTTYDRMNSKVSEEFLNTTLLALVNNSIEKNKDKIALISSDKRYNYAELDAESSRIADYLQKNMKDDETNVAVYADRKPESIISILGILKAGKTYIPIIPSYPKDRIDYIMGKSNTKIIIDDKTYAKAINEGSLNYKEKRVDPDDIAYIIFTSGSTGMPKGVEVTHGGAANTVLAIKESIGLNSNDKLMGFSSFCFDLSVFDIFGTLSTGAAYVFVEEPRDVFLVQDIIKKENVTVWNSVPSMIDLFISNTENIEPDCSLRMVMLSGDTISPGLPQKINKYFGNITIWALGGSTEASIWSSGIEISNWKEEDGAIPYGFPLKNQRMYVLDEDKLLCPIDIKGELYIGGVGLANGYCDDIEKTEEAFIYDERFGRIYKTGDTASLNAKGYIDFYGRKDNQIKIKGYRVELGEIESVAKNISGVIQAIALFEKKSETIKLFYSTKETFFNEDNIKDALLKKLPEYMIPQCFIKVNKFPLSNNGKIDRKALALLETKDTISETHNEKKEEHIDIELCNLILTMMEELLGKSLDIDDSFFLNGGDSIKAIQLVSKLKKAGLKITIKEIFKNPTPYKISKIIKKENTPLNNPIEKNVSIELSPIQKWFFENIGLENYWNQAIAIYRKDGFEKNELERCLKIIISYQDAFRILVHRNEKEIGIGLSEKLDSIFKIKEVYVGDVDDKDKLKEEINAAHKSLDLLNGPLMYLILFKTQNGDHLFITAHHIMIDGVSWRILYDSFNELYGNAKNNVLKSITPFWKWNKKLKEYALNNELHKEIPFWEGMIKEGNNILYPSAGANLVRNSILKTLEFDEGFTNKLIKLSSEEYNGNLGNILLTALAVTYNKLDDREGIQIWLEGHGREDIFEGLDIYDTIGWFTSLYPVFYRCYSDLEMQKNEILTTTQKIPKNGIGFGIINYLMPKKYKEAFPETHNKEICFNYLGDMSFEKSNGNMELSSLDVGELLNPDSKRAFMIDVVAKIVHGKLIIQFIINKEYGKYGNKSDLVEEYRNMLEKITDKEAKYRENQFLPFPLTDMQMSYYFGRNTSYEMGGVATHSYTEIETNIDVQLFNCALNKAIARHNMLRCIILPSGEQKVLEHVPEYKVKEIDLTAFDKKEQKNMLEKVRMELSHQVLDPEKWPLFEFVLLKISDNKQILAISRDLLIADASSMDIFGNDVVFYYNNPEKELPPLQYTFKEYIEEYTALKKTHEYEEDKQFWQDKIEKFPLAPVLPTIQDPSSVVKPHFDRVEQIYDNEFWSKLKNVASLHGVTPTAIFATLYGKVLSEYSNQKHIPLNLTVYNRYPFNEEVETLIGDFTSNMLLDIDFIEPNLWEQIALVQDNLWDNVEHRLYEGVEFVRDLIQYNSLDGKKANMPYILTSILSDESEENGWQTFGDVKTGITQTSQVYIDFQLTILNGELWAFWDYVSDIFDRNMIHNMFASVMRTLEALVNAEYNETQLLNTNVDIINQYNNTKYNFKESNITKVFYSSAYQFGNRIAIRHDQEQITYNELNSASNKVASYLRGKGIGAGDHILIEAAREIGSIVNILGVLKAGAAYVPVDPSYPEERKCYIYDNAKARMSLEPDFYKTDEVQMLDGEDHPVYNLPSDEAYIIYTSGSTGNPKGVVITHEAAMNTIADINERFHITEKDRFIGLSSMCFDLSVYDIFGALLSGATLVMVNDQRDADEIAELLEKEEITVWNSVPAIMEMTLSNLEGRRAGDALRLVLLSGDWIAKALPDRIMETFDKAEVISLGGATEASIWSIYYPVPRNDTVDCSTVPYGMPLRNQTIHILNYEGKDCPVGVMGEICIGGVGVAKEYMGDRERTENSFVETSAYGRIYRTGDYGIMHPEGFVEFIGRKDNQVKIRGYRVELGEIEKKMEGHEFINSAVVLLIEDGQGQKVLCGYYTSEEELEPSEIRTYLERELPQYMIPAIFMELDELPLTANGKVDRKVLPKPDLTKIAERRYKEPRNETEKRLEAIWEEVLGCEKIGIDENFFELGGNSITMVKVRTEISREFNVDLALKELLKYNTIEKLSEILEKEEAHDRESLTYPHIEHDEEHMYDAFPLTDVQMAYLMGRDESYELGGISTHGYAEILTTLNISKLETALNQVIENNEMMRAVILPSGYQKILKEVPKYHILWEDISELSKYEQDQRIFDIRNRMSHQIFDVEKWPLFEYHALKISDDKNYLFISHDMMIMDSASIQLIGNQLWRFYNDDRTWKKPQITFRDYIIQLKEFKKTNKYEEDKKYWLNKIKEFPLAPSLPLRTPIDKVKDPHFRRKSAFLPADKWDVLKRAAVQNNVSISAILGWVYGKIISLYSNTTKFSVNTTVFNRLPFHEDIEQIIGDFTSVILLEFDFTQKETIWEGIRRLQNQLLEALDHRHYDGIEFIRELSNYHGMNGRAVMPIVFTSVILDKNISDQAGWSNIGEFHSGSGQTSQVYLDYQAYEENGGLEIVWDYIEEVFEEEIIDNLFTEYVNSVEKCVAENEFKSIGLYERFWNKYNDTFRKNFSNNITTCLYESKDKYSNRIALQHDQEQITYYELNSASNKVASYLRGKGIGAGDHILIEAAREIGSIVNILGVLKAGAAYVPVDPSYPEERKCYIYDNAKARMSLEPDFYKTDEVQMLDGEDHPVYNLPSDEAYIIYTSGSTGNPKGVVITHEAAMNTIADINERFHITEKDRFIGLSSMCFDLSVYDIFGALLSGATLVMVNDQRDADEIAELLEKEEITVWNSVPAIMEMTLSNLEGRRAGDALRLVLLSGDWIAKALPDRIMETFDKAEVISLGGATEASIWSIYYPVPRNDTVDCSTVPYGMPLRNQTIHILNYEGKDCPVGVMGEICIGGVGVAKEYMGDRERTENSFVETSAYGRIYRTGDYGIMHPEGFVEFIGRKDNQVKIRGYRVELGEIEKKMEGHEFINSAVVLLIEDGQGQKVLCGYYTSEEELEPSEIRTYLERELPQYMIPAIFMELDELPLTANGKVDRKVLPKPDLTKIAERRYKEPRNETEKRLEAIWEEVLGCEKIGIDENFFELGGNSITMVKVRTEISREFNVDLALKELLKYNTIEKLSEILEKEEAHDRESLTYPHIEHDEEHMYDAFPLTDVQMAYLMGRDESYELGGVSTHVYLEVKTKLDIVLFERALNKVILKHPMLHAIISSNGEQRILKDFPTYKIPVEDITYLSEMEQQKLIIQKRQEMSHEIFDIGTWPMFSYFVYKLSDTESYMFIGYDMLITDGASFQYIHRDLLNYYYMDIDERNVNGFCFRDYVIAVQEFKKSNIYLRDKAYWLDLIEDFPEAPRLPYSNSIESIKNPHFKRLQRTISSKDYNFIKKIAKQKDITTTALLLAAYAKVLSRWSNQERIAINCTVFNRIPFNDEVYNLVGDFTSTMLLAVDINKEVDYWENVKKIQMRLLESLEHRHYDGIEFLRDLMKFHNVPRNRALMPVVFTSMLIGQENQEAGDHEIGTVEMAVSQTSQVYLDYQVMESEGKLIISWDYVEELFDDIIINEMFNQYIQLILSENGKDILHLPENQEKKLNLYNSTKYSFALPNSPIELFKKQCELCPDKIAVKHDSEYITYKQLDCESDSLAYYLHQKKVGHGDFIGVIGNRDIKTIISILAILKIGAAYIPIDPNQPQTRKNQIIESSKCKLVFDSKDPISLNKANEHEMISYKFQKDDVCYTIFTSGSTGTPKGVVITNEQMLNTIMDINKKFNIEEKDMVLGISSLSFDLSVFDIFGTLTAGATLVLVNDQKNIEEIANKLYQEKITIWNSVPALMELMIDYLKLHSDEYSKNLVLRLVLLSGDWIPKKLPEEIKQIFLAASIISLGGATEASIWSNYYDTELIEDYEIIDSIPYGIPLANQQLYILNYDGEQCPIDVKGEIFIGGSGVAVGYLNDLHKTQNSFVVHEKWGKLYKTGDFGVFRKEGYIEFLGRKDGQVKINGYRVELGEIEKSIERLEYIEKCVVLCKRVNKQNKLCAFLKLKQDTKKGVEVIKEDIMHFVPSYMVPAFISVIETFPLSSNGKVNRKALPDITNLNTEVYKEKPKNSKETLLCNIVEELLGRKDIGVTENLFDMGMDSVLAIKLISRLEQHNISINLKTIYEYQTIRNIVSTLEDPEEKGKVDNQYVMCLNKAKSSKKNIFCFPPVVSIGVVYKKFAELIGDYNVYSFDFIPASNRLEIYKELIENIQSGGEYIFVGISAGGNLAFELAKEFEKSEKTVAKLILLDSFYIDEVNPNEMTEETSEDYAIKAADTMLKQYPELGVEKEYKKKLISNIRSYYKYLDTLINTGTVNSSIYVIKSPTRTNKHIRGEIEGWRNCTQSLFEICVGAGDHSEMLDKGYVEKNVEIIKKML